METCNQEGGKVLGEKRKRRGREEERRARRGQKSGIGFLKQAAKCLSSLLQQ